MTRFLTIEEFREVIDASIRPNNKALETFGIPHNDYDGNLEYDLDIILDRLI